MLYKVLLLGGTSTILLLRIVYFGEGGFNLRLILNLFFATSLVVIDILGRLQEILKINRAKLLTWIYELVVMLNFRFNQISFAFILQFK